MRILGSTFLPVMDVLRGMLSGEDVLQDFDPVRTLIEQVVQADVLILGMARVTQDVLDGGPRLRLIHQHGRGVDGVDLAAATRRGVLVANVPGGNSVSVAEHALALMLHLAKRMYAAGSSIRARVLGTPAGLEMTGKTLGIVGLGASGTELAVRAKALGMRVLAVKAKPERSPDLAVDWVGAPADLSRLLRESDFVSLHVPLTDATRGLIGRAELAMMKRSAYLINVARGLLVDHDALLDALRNGQIAGAAADVFWQEPADPHDPILACENFVLTPHVAGFTDASIAHVCRIIIDNIERLRRGGRLQNVVNAEAYE